MSMVCYRSWPVERQIRRSVNHIVSWWWWCFGYRTAVKPWPAGHRELCQGKQWSLAAHPLRCFSRLLQMLPPPFFSADLPSSLQDWHFMCFSQIEGSWKNWHILTETEVWTRRADRSEGTQNKNRSCEQTADMYLSIYVVLSYGHAYVVQEDWSSLPNFQIVL